MLTLILKSVSDAHGNGGGDECQPIAPSHAGEIPLLDTSITACKHCAKRLIKFGANVHMHEYHSGMISNDSDDGILERIKEEGAV